MLPIELSFMPDPHVQSMGCLFLELVELLLIFNISQSFELFLVKIHFLSKLVLNHFVIRRFSLYEFRQLKNFLILRIVVLLISKVFTKFL